MIRELSLFSWSYNSRKKNSIYLLMQAMPHACFNVNLFQLWQKLCFDWRTCIQVWILLVEKLMTDWLTDLSSRLPFLMPWWSLNRPTRLFKSLRLNCEPHGLKYFHDSLNWFVSFAEYFKELIFHHKRILRMNLISIIRIQN